MNDTFQNNTENDKTVNKTRELEEISNKIDNSKWVKVEKNIQRLQDMQYIFDKNHDELIEHIDKLLDNEFENILEKSVELSWIEIRQKTLRYLFNYLSSAVALHEHTKKFMGEYEGTEFDTKAMEWIENNIPKGINYFNREIRRFLIHFKLPKTLVQSDLTNTDSEKPNKYVLLDVLSTINYDQFKNKESKEYLISIYLSSGMDLKKFCDDYYYIMCNYYKWFFAELKEYHKNEYYEYICLIEKKNYLLANGE